jgi:hypothetical protein
MDHHDGIRLPTSAHTSRPWRIHALATGFRLEDVWALPTPGGPDDLPRVIDLLAAGAVARSSSHAARALWALRWQIGRLLGWDRAEAGLGARVPTLRDRLPADLRDAPHGPEVAPFAPLYLTRDEWAAEIANRTVHGIVHIGWVTGGDGTHRGEMAVYVRPNGVLGSAYMAAITPFRHFVVYPAMVRDLGRAWRLSQAGAPIRQRDGRA